MNFDSVENMLRGAEEMGLPLWACIMRADCEEIGRSDEQSLAEMRKRLAAMRSADSSYDPQQRSPSGLVGGAAEKMKTQVEAGKSISGDFIGKILAGALRMGECNACMHRIVAAPTAGACGVIPAVLFPYAEKFAVPEEELVKALFITAGFGAVIANRASISGAEAGCQAEIGSASAMSAAALVFLHGGDNRQMATAVAIALKNLMGLVCDPVAGLVEVPCVKRNVVGSVNAVSCADMALAGVESRIPVDEVIDGMGEVGRRMPMEMRETALGGLAATPTGKAVKERMEQQD